jgi:hypothetical protein
MVLPWTVGRDIVAFLSRKKDKVNGGAHMNCWRDAYHTPLRGNRSELKSAWSKVIVPAGIHLG